MALVCVLGLVAGMAATPPSEPTPREYARDRLIARYGDEGHRQFDCLDALWKRESGWRMDAVNRRSGAYGIPQALPATRMATVGADWRTNPITQVEWGIRYISGRYGPPCLALDHALRRGWY